MKLTKTLVLIPEFNLTYEIKRKPKLEALLFKEVRKLH